MESETFMLGGRQDFCTEIKVSADLLSKLSEKLEKEIPETD